MNFTKDQVLEAQKNIRAFELKKMNAADYIKFAANLLGVTPCDTCNDESIRLHEDLQKRITLECKNKYPELLQAAPTFKSGKYSGDYYKIFIAKCTFKHLRNLAKTMKQDAIMHGQMKKHDQAKLIEGDILELKAYILQKEVGCDSEETTGKVDLDSEKKADSVEDKGVLSEVEKEIAVKILNSNAAKELGIALTFDEKIEENSEEDKAIEDKIRDEVIENAALAEDEVEPIEHEAEPEKQKPVWNLQDAIALQNGGMLLKEIAKYYGISESSVSNKLRKA